MSVPVESKKTEFGIIPSDWLETKLSDFILKFRGGAPLAPTDFTDQGVKVLPKVGIVKGGILKIEKGKQQYCSQEYAERHQSNIVDNNFIIVVLRDLVPSGPSIGLMVRIDLNDRYVLAQGTYGFTVNLQQIAPSYLIHLSNTVQYRKIMHNIMVGSTQVHITNGLFKQVKIPLPPTRTEQTAIAAVLSDMDALIEGVEKLLEKKRRIKQGAMQELLRPKEGWRKKKLGELFEINAGGDVEKEFFSNRTDEKYPYPIYSNSLSNYGLYGYSSHFTSDGNCITVTARGTIGYACFRDHRFAAIGRLLVLRPKLDVDCFYISEFINNKIKFAFEVTGVPQLTAPQISKYDVWISDKKSEQTAIAAVLSDMDSEIEQLETQLTKYRQLKTGMMQELLTGKKRLL